MAWNRPSGVPKVAQKKKPSVLRGLIVVGVVCVITAVVAVIVFSGGDAKQKTRAAKRANVIRETKAAVAKAVASKNVKEEEPPVPKTEKGNELDGERDIVSTGLVAVVEQGEKCPRKQVFKHATDQLIYLAVFASRGSMIPPLPMISKADTQKYIDSLREPIEIDPDDPPQVQEMKKNVNEVRQQIADLIVREPDLQLSEILNTHRDDFNSKLNLRSEAQRTYEKFVAEGAAEDAEIYRKKVNDLLEQYGANPIEEKMSDETEDDL